MRTRERAARGGMALVITLVFVALITILVVAMSASVLLDRPAAKSHFEKVRAMQFAQAGVDQVVATLRQNIGLTNSSWISGPGQVISASSTVNNILNTTNRLYSGTANTALTGTFQPQSLNLATFQDPSSYLISGQPDSSGSIPRMQVAWVYVRQSGTNDFSGSPALGTGTNSIVGRYAYWTDDESSKVNLNLAWGRGSGNATASYGFPTKVDLTALTNMTSSEADTLHTYLTTNGYATLQNDLYNSPKDARRVGSPVSSVLATNQFSTTFYNHDPDRNCFGLPRIVLTTQKSLAGGRPFLDILTTDNIDPGNANNIDVTKLNTVLFGSGGTYKAPVYPGLFWYLVRKDWPMAPNSSFVQKYAISSATATNGISEMALNIIEYTRCKESTNNIVIPIRGSLSGTTFTFGFGGGPLLGCVRAPRVTEVGMWIASTGAFAGNPSKYLSTAQARIELYLPPSYGLASVDLTKMAELVQYGDVDGNFEQAINQSIAAADCSPSSILTNGGYVTVSHTFPLEMSFITGSPPARPTVIPMRVAISVGTDGTTNIVNITSQGFNPPSTTMIPVPVDAVGVAANNITSMEVDDPNGNLNYGDWKICKRVVSPTNTFGSINSVSTLHKTQANVFPEQDTEAFGQLSDASLYMPPPRGQTFTSPVTGAVDDNTAGAVSSVGELGYVPTGMEISTNDIPWRTVRLQPNGQASSVVPDWALLDLFTVPSIGVSAGTNADYVIVPHSTSIGGRININSGVNSAPFSLNRTTPLAAAFSGCFVSQTNSTTVTATQAQTLAQNVYGGVISPGNSGNGFPEVGKQYAGVPYFYSPGQIAEISGVSDQGEASEQLVRQAVNQLTTRGDVFTVYSVGQSLQQTAAGNLLVTGEERLQAVVERYLDATVTPAAIRFRILYFQRLTP